MAINTLVCQDHWQRAIQQTGSWSMKFVVCQTIGGDELKAKKLPTPLEGEPLTIWLELSQEQ